MTIGSILLIIALLCFLAATAEIAARINLTAAGLACLTLALLFWDTRLFL